MDRLSDPFGQSGKAAEDGLAKSSFAKLRVDCRVSPKPVSLHDPAQAVRKSCVCAMQAIQFGSSWPARGRAQLPQ